MFSHSWCTGSTRLLERFQWKYVKRERGGCLWLGYIVFDLVTAYVNILRDSIFHTKAELFIRRAQTSRTEICMFLENSILLLHISNLTSAPMASWHQQSSTINEYMKSLWTSVFIEGNVDSSPEPLSTWYPYTGHPYRWKMSNLLWPRASTHLYGSN